MNDTALAFKSRLLDHLNIDIDVTVNENRSTMLSLLEKSRHKARLSVHKMFLDAPDPVISAIAQYIRGTKKQHPILRQFIQEHLAQGDYTHLVNRYHLVQQGRSYHLQTIYDKLNQKYFMGKLQLSITWYGKPHIARRRRQITFGQYLSGLRLIKIHRLLDDPFFPPYFVAFVIYHEMLHSVIPGTVDRRGRFCFHSRAFKDHEKHFEEYKQAIEWERNNKAKLYGWA